MSGFDCPVFSPKAAKTTLLYCNIRNRNHTRSGRRVSETCPASVFPKLAAFANLLPEQATIVRPGSGNCKKRKLNFEIFCVRGLRRVNPDAGGSVVLDFRLVRCYLTRMKTVVSSKGQIVLPAELRQRDRIVPGQRFEIERLDAGQYLLRKQEAPDNEGLVDWLLDCPVKGWFQPIASESTATL
ncbi:MAG TPA: AbrB/MazE/SpoVT family DNA-binding domain-containing protein [Gemmataceae bacterium]|nr:AbrB/MazE/SpoVT family DNA-binding domain-containing protein [Gemmataceae bacterium]